MFFFINEADIFVFFKVKRNGQRLRTRVKFVNENFPAIIHRLGIVVIVCFGGIGPSIYHPVRVSWRT